MRKRIYSLLLILAAAAMLAACGKENSISIEEKDGKVTLQVPPSLENTFSLSRPMLDAGFAENEADHSYQIEKKDYDAFLQTLRDKIDTNLANANESKDYPSISGIQLNKKMEKLEVSIDPAAYEASDDGTIVHALGTQILLYRIYAGESPKLEIRYVDAESKSVYDTEKISY